MYNFKALDNNSIFYFTNCVNAPKKYIEHLEEMDKNLDSYPYIEKWRDWTASNDQSNIYGQQKYIDSRSLSNDQNLNKKMLYLINAIKEPLHMCSNRYADAKQLGNITEINYFAINKYFSGQAMGPHLDSYGDSNKITFSTLIYLNDNYEGGEISFLDEKQSKVINYKPEKGDIIVFPSGAPYYHGVFPVKTNERYVLRMFRFWNYEGSQKWHENKEKYGADDWNKIESERIKKAYDSGDYHRTVVFPGQKIDTNLFHTKLFYAKEKAILYKKEKNNNYE